MTTRGYTRRCGTLVTRFERRRGGALKFIETLSEEMVRKLGKTEPPFQTEAFEYAKLVGAKVIENDIIPSGMMSVLNGKIIIEVKQSESLERKSYTVCHEVAHIEMRKAAKLFTISQKGRVINVPARKKEEFWAQKFAENLLMPREVFLRKASVLNPSMTSVIQLAKIFRTSLDATIRRVASLGVWKCVIVWGVPEKMLGDKRWAVEIQECKSSLPGSPFCPRSKYVWWGGEAVNDAFNCNSIVTRTIAIEDQNWWFEGLRHFHCKRNGELERRVVALLLPLAAD